MEQASPDLALIVSHFTTSLQPNKFVEQSSNMAVTCFTNCFWSKAIWQLTVHLALEIVLLLFFQCLNESSVSAWTLAKWQSCSLSTAFQADWFILLVFVSVPLNGLLVSAWEKQMWESVVLTILMHSYYTSFINLADALIQSDFQMRKTQHLLAWICITWDYLICFAPRLNISLIFSL